MEAIRWLAVVGLLVGFAAQGMTKKVTVERTNAYFMQNSENTLFQSLDLKRETFAFKNPDFDSCEAKMTRNFGTLHYSCTIQLPVQARISKRHNQITPVVMTIPYAGQDRRVLVTVSDDATSVIYSTEFDKIGVDFDMTKFNDDFFNVYAKTAANVITLAMKKSLVVEVLESHDKKLASSN